MKLKTAKIVVVGSCNMDLYTWTNHLPEAGETVIGDRFWMGMGGKGANQAVGAAKLGARAIMVGRLGQDMFGDQMISTLESHEVGSDFITRDPGQSSGVAMVIVDQDAENIIAVVPGTNMAIEISDIEAAADEIRDADVLMMQLEIPVPVVQRAVLIASKGKARIILNPAPACDLPADLLHQVDYLTPNQSEARFLTGLPTESLDGARAAALELRRKGVEIVVITMGAQGALVADELGVRHIPGYPVNSVDSSGAGDAFMAGLGVALAEGQGLDQAIRFANRVGALSTTRPGAMPSIPTRAEVEAFVPNEV